MIPLRFRRQVLILFGRLPARLRRAIVRAASPTFLVGAACIVEHEGRLLAVRHSYMRHWGLTGGGMNRGEVPEATAVREVAEEAGLAVEPIGSPVLVVDAPRKRIDLVLRCRLAPGASPADAHPRSAEITEVRWVPIEELPDLRWARAAEAALRQGGFVTRRPG
ncbi:MAG: NUDIX domain-containing protein [Acidimicrobiia bacterium]|nr:NUDIX domain-containing protein [Acidimicrobiia bacterium]